LRLYLELIMFKRYPISPPVTLTPKTALFITGVKQIIYLSGNKTQLRADPATTAPNPKRVIELVMVQSSSLVLLVELRLYSPLRVKKIKRRVYITVSPVLTKYKPNATKFKELIKATSKIKSFE